MANIHPDIKPSGMTMKREVDLWYQLIEGFRTLCLQLDGDAQVNDDTHTALCYTAIINSVVHDSKGNRTGQQVKEENFYEVGPTGLTDAARLQLLYNYFNAWETLCEQFDANAGGITGTNFEALCYTALLLHKVEDTKGNILGNGTTFYFRPGGVMNQKELIECYYNMVNAFNTLTLKLDADGTVTDITYKALCYTAIILTRIENAAGSVIGTGSKF